MTQSVDPGGLNNCRQQIRSFYMHSSNSYPKPAVTLLFESLKGQGKSNQCSIICNRDHTGHRFQKYSHHFMRLQIVFRSKSENDNRESISSYQTKLTNGYHQRKQLDWLAVALAQATDDPSCSRALIKLEIKLSSVFKSHKLIIPCTGFVEYILFFNN